MYPTQLEFPEGWGGGRGFLKNIPSMEEVWILTAITHYTSQEAHVVILREFSNITCKENP